MAKNWRAHVRHLNFKCYVQITSLTPNKNTISEDIANEGKVRWAHQGVLRIVFFEFHGCIEVFGFGRFSQVCDHRDSRRSQWDKSNLQGVQKFKFQQIQERSSISRSACQTGELETTCMQQNAKSSNKGQIQYQAYGDAPWRVALTSKDSPSRHAFPLHPREWSPHILVRKPWLKRTPLLCRKTAHHGECRLVHGVPL